MELSNKNRAFELRVHINKYAKEKNAFYTRIWISRGFINKNKYPTRTYLGTQIHTPTCVLQVNDCMVGKSIFVEIDSHVYVLITLVECWNAKELNKLYATCLCHITNMIVLLYGYCNHVHCNMVTFETYGQVWMMIYSKLYFMRGNWNYSN